MMKNRKKLAKGVVALSMALTFGAAILAPTHEAVASGGSECSNCKSSWCQSSMSYRACNSSGNGVSCAAYTLCSH